MVEERERRAKVIVPYCQLLKHTTFFSCEHQLIELIVDLGHYETEEN